MAAVSILLRWFAVGPAGMIDPWTDLPLEEGPREVLDAIRADDLDRVRELIALGRCQQFVHGRQSEQVFREVATVRRWSELSDCDLQYGEWHGADQGEDGPRYQPRQMYRRLMLANMWDKDDLPVDTYVQFLHMNYMLACDVRRAHRNTMSVFGGARAWVVGNRTTQRVATYARLEIAVTCAWVELLAGRLALAESLSRQASTLGLAEDHQRDQATDMLAFVQVARGVEAPRRPMALPAMLAGPRGPNPALTGLWLLDACFLSVLLEPQAVESRALNAQTIAARLGSPRMIGQSEAWLAAAHLLSDNRAALTQELPAILQMTRGATPGLRALPLFVSGVASGRPEQLRDCVRLARQTGQGWLEVAGLAWLVNGGERSAVKDFHRLIRATGWRVPMLVSRAVRAAVATRLAAAGERSAALLELALATGDEAAILAVAAAHLRDHPASFDSAALALSRLRSGAARDLLEAAVRTKGPQAAAAAAAMNRRQTRLGLSPREIEVLKLASAGLTNQQIGAKLSISPHTVARHLENSRTKLGASNRAEAVARLGAMSAD